MSWLSEAWSNFWAGSWVEPAIFDIQNTFLLFLLATITITFPWFVSLLPSIAFSATKSSFDDGIIYGIVDVYGSLVDRIHLFINGQSKEIKEEKSSSELLDIFGWIKTILSSIPKILLEHGIFMFYLFGIYKVFSALLPNTFSIYQSILDNGLNFANISNLIISMFTHGNFLSYVMIALLSVASIFVFYILSWCIFYYSMESFSAFARRSVDCWNHNVVALFLTFGVLSGFFGVLGINVIAPIDSLCAVFMHIIVLCIVAFCLFIIGSILIIIAELIYRLVSLIIGR